MAEIGARTGIFRSDESKILENLLRFHSVRAKDVMTPSTVLESAPEDMTLQAFHEARPNLRFSRIPVYETGAKHHVTGYVLKDHVLAKLLEDGGADTPLSKLRREILVVMEQTPIPQVLNRFIEKREHIAMVVDEFGSTAGVVTMEDVIETLLGVEIVDEMDHTVDMQRLARRRWEERARSLGLIGLGGERADDPPGGESGSAS
jgi:CBS domain containing-hemolysin-like protein